MFKGTNASTPTKLTGISVQTSAQGVCIALAWGKVRVAPNLVWYNNFIAKPIKQGKGGKGGGKGFTSYQYSAAVILGLCEGPITSIGKVWADQNETTLAKLGLTLFLGTAAQAPWSYVTSKYPTEARAYAYTAYVANESYQLGQSPVLPNHNMEVVTPLSGSMPGTPDVNLADVIPDFLNNVQFGIGPCAINATWLATFKTYCRAQGLFFSPLLQSSEQVSQVLDRWAGLTNTWIFWSGPSLKTVPLGDEVITANGVTYTPDLTIQKALGPSDFITDGNGPAVTITRADLADCPNYVKLQVKDRNNAYNAASVEYQNSALVRRYGRIDANVSQANEICDLTVANTVAKLVGQRNANNRNQYAFTLNAQIGSITEPGDLFTVYDPASGVFSPRLVRVVQLDEDSKGYWSVSAEQFVPRMGSVDVTGTPSSGGTTVDTQVDPGNVNPPAVFEPRSDLTNGVAQIWIAASGGSDWGGCVVMGSFDGLEYTPFGVISSPAWQGPLLSALPSHSDPDTVNTLSVDLTPSDGIMNTAVTNADADAMRTLALITPTFSTVLPTNVEMVSYGNVVQGAGANKFDLTYLRRGLYSTTIGAHSAGSLFSRFDLNDVVSGVGNSVVDYDLPQAYIGQTIYLKFLSFNRFNPSVTQDISSVTEYTYTPIGSGFGGGTAGIPMVPTGLAVTTGNGQNQITWNANASTDNVTSYTLYAAPGLSQPFGSASIVYKGLSTRFIHSGIGNSGAYTYFVLATNSVGSSSPTSGVNGTTAAAGIGTVTSIDVAVPSRQTSSGGPVTGAGTITITDNVQSANQFFAGPASGPSAAPSFRVLGTTDIPDLSATYLSLAAGGTVAASVKFANGSLGTPGIRFNTSDGFFSTGAGDLEVSIGGAQSAIFGTAANAIRLDGSPGVGTIGLNVQGNGVTQVLVSRFTNDANEGSWRTRKSRGVVGTPLVPVLNDFLGNFAFEGYDGSSYTVGARYRCQLIETGTVGSGAMGCQHVFFAAAIGSGSQTEIMRLNTANGIQLFGANTVIDANRIFRPRSYTIATLPAVPATGIVFCSDLGGGAGNLYSDGTKWCRGGVEGYETQSTATGAKTINVLTNAVYQNFTATLTGNVTLTLGTTNAYKGAKFTVRTSGIGIFTFTVVDGGTGTPTLITVPVSTAKSMTFVYDGTNWQMMQDSTI